VKEQNQTNEDLSVFFNSYVLSDKEKKKYTTIFEDFIARHTSEIHQVPKVLK
jgi:hypothetical protein